MKRGQYSYLIYIHQTGTLCFDVVLDRGQGIMSDGQCHTVRFLLVKGAKRIE